MSNDTYNDESPVVVDQLMQLQVLLPFKVFANYESIESIVLETKSGAFGLLPNRRDCVADIEPGVLTYTRQDQEPSYIAIDEGVMVKKGQQVWISVRNAHTDVDLKALKESVKTVFLNLTEQERDVRAVLARLESGFMRGFKVLNHD